MPSAKQDIKDIYSFIYERSGPNSADAVIDQIEQRIDNLATMPGRGNIPKELIAIGRKDYRELHFKPYRTFYRIIGSKVEVMAVWDGRRNIAALLQLRLTRL
jgi:toxin ParE1/3/4